MPVTELECEECGVVVAWADADGLFTDGADATCGNCCARWTVSADEGYAGLRRVDE
jgi:hypothetical protein